MKKLIIGLAAGAMALGASVVPASAGYGPLDLPYDEETGSMWDYIESENGYAEQLVLLSGLANTLDTCGNGKTLYTLFLPLDDILEYVIYDVLDTTVADLAATPAVVKGILSDHLVDGAVDPLLLTSVPAGIKKLVAVSGYVINIRAIKTLEYVPSVPSVWTDWYANGNQLTGATVTCNGWIYDMFGMFDPRDYAETFGTDNKPPTGSAVSELPETL